METASDTELEGFARGARAFLEDLSRYNTRAWFRENKSRYDAEVKRPAETLVASVASGLEDAHGLPVHGKVFRPHRDIRFSDDKTPFFTHLHAAWSVPDGRGWYFGLSPSYASAGGGVMQFDEEQDAHWRGAVDGPAGAALEAALAVPGARLDPPDLDEVPEPYPDDHPRADLLRRRGCLLWLDDLFEPLDRDPAAGLLDAFDRIAPLQRWLGEHL